MMKCKRSAKESNATKCLNKKINISLNQNKPKNILKATAKK